MSIATIANVVSAVSGQTPVTAKAKSLWRKGEPYKISSDIDADKGKFATQNQNQLNVSAEVHFLHYGHDHLDSSKKFPGQQQSQQGQQNAGNAALNRGILFRDCLEREAILLHGFIFSSRAVMAEYEEPAGVMGMASDAVSALALGTSAPSKPDANELDKFLKRVKDTTQKINTTTVKYPDLYDAGKELHQIRADYEAFLETLVNYYILKPSQQAGTGGVASVAGKIQSAASTVASYALKAVPASWVPWVKLPFKTSDIYLAMYLTMAWAMESGIADQSYNLSMAAAPLDHQPSNTYPLWDAVPNQSTQGSTSSDPLGKDPLEKFNKLLENGDAEHEKRDQEKLDKLSATDKATRQGEDAVRLRVWYKPTDIYRYAFMGVSGITSFGSPGGSSLSNNSWVQTATAGANAVSKNLLTDAKKGDDYPDPVLNTMLGTGDKIEFIQAVYTEIAKDPAKAIDDEFLLKLARKIFVDRLLKWVDLKDNLKTQIPGQSQETNFGEMGRDSLANQHNEWVDKVVEFAVISKDNHTSIKRILEDARKEAKKADPKIAMEVYLSRTSWILASLFRNTFFPMWQWVLDHTFGYIPEYSTLMKALSDANKGVLSGLSSARTGADKVTKAGDGIKDSAGGNTPDTGSIGQYASNLINAIGVNGPAFPLESRQSGGKGQDVTEQDKQHVDGDKLDFE